MEASNTANGNVEWFSRLGKQPGSSSKVRWRIFTGPVISLLGIYLSAIKTYSAYKNRFVNVIASLFIIAKKWI